MAVDLVGATPASLADRQRRRWLAAVLAATILPPVLVVPLAPAQAALPGPTLTWLLFLGSSVHIAATFWFPSVVEVRTYLRAHPARYFWAPLILVAGLAAAVAKLPDHALAGILLAFFVWQFFHFQKQNLGIVALAARATGAPSLTRFERRVLVAAAVGGIAGLVGRPGLLQVSGVADRSWLFVLGALVFGAAWIAGFACVVRRRAVGAVSIAQVAALSFFLPVFVFASPYAAVAGLTIAHGVQYLLLVGSLARSPTGRAAPWPALAAAAVLLGLLLNRASHLHTGGPLARAAYGGYLGVLCTHFVWDAGLWRLREAWPRAFLSRRLPYLLR